MTTVITIYKTRADHLAKVTEAMRTAGAPTIRVIRDEAQGIVLALEGSHRLAAAKALGLDPVFVVLGDDDVISWRDLGLLKGGPFDARMRAADLRDCIAGPMGMYRSLGEWLDFDIAPPGSGRAIGAGPDPVS
jgi:hypothetical protein